MAGLVFPYFLKLINVHHYLRPLADLLQHGLLRVYCQNHLLKVQCAPILHGGHVTVTKVLLQTHRLKECVAPVLSVLTECARMHRPARKFLKAQVLGKGDGTGEHGLDPLDRSLEAPSQHSEELPP